MTTKIKSFKHFTEEDRYTIYHMRFTEERSLSEVGKFLGKSKSAVCTEINRNSFKGKYIPMIAEKKYKTRLHKGGFCKIESNQEIFDYIVNRLKKDKWSPDVIAAKIYGDIGFTISAETIYNFIYNSAKAKSKELYKYLPSRRSTRLNKGLEKENILFLVEFPYINAKQ